MSIKRAADPRNAIRYAQGRRAGNHLAAVVWLTLALVALVIIRRGGAPTLSEGATLAGAGILAVAAGEVAGTLVLVFLVALLIAGVLGFAGPITAALDDVTARVAALGQPPTPGA